jgi:uncharacterized protein (DUF362 family)
MAGHDDKRNWTRREVLGEVFLPAAGVVLLGGLAGCRRAPESLKTDKRVAGILPCDLVVVENGEPADLVKRALQELGGMGRFVSRGDVVVIKPNIGFNRAPEQAANTNPDVVRELAVEVLNAGAKTVRIFDHTLYEPRHCYARSGIAPAVQGLGVQLEFTDERKFVNVNTKGQWLKEWPLYRDVLEADKVINVPIAKQHSTARLSMGFKNLMGVIGGKRESFHQNIHIALADLGGYLRPTLTVLDAYRILLRNGPQGGSLSDVRTARTLAAGVDMVAVDAFGCSLFDIPPSQMGYLREAMARQLGTLDLSGLRLRKVTL